MGFKALLGFAPFAAFILIENLFGTVPGLVAGLAASLALLAWEAVRGHRTINILEAGSAVMFAGLAILAVSEGRTWSVWEVRLYVDLGLALVVFLSVVLRRPFTLQSGRQAVSPDVAATTDFLRHNILLSSAWGLAFLGLAAIDLRMVAYPDTPARRGIILTVVVLAAAAKFTQWYVKRIRRAA
jgi:hypothetical protein